jgi:putative ABC transport system substrate-binding protein
LVPNATTIALLANDNNPQTAAQIADVEAASRTFGQQVVFFKAGSDSDIEEAFAALAQRRVGALLFSADPFFLSRRYQFVALVARHSIPAMYEWRLSLPVIALSRHDQARLPCPPPRVMRTSSLGRIYGYTP